jgi:divalent metal cation (Fe/Co/Zn/Cd) transporter
VLLEDTADLTGIAIAFLGIYFGHRLGNPYLDGIASIAIGLVLAIVATILIAQTRSLLLGEGADSDVIASIRSVIAAEQAIVSAKYPLTVHLGPHDVFVAIAAEFAPGLRAEEIAEVIVRVESAIRAAESDVNHIYIEAASLGRRDR